MNTPTRQPSYLEDFQKVKVEEKDDYASHHCKRGLDGLVRIKKDQLRFLFFIFFLQWMVKDETTNVCESKVKNSFFKPL